MNALRPLAEAAFHGGINLYGDPYRRMFLAPLDLAMSDGRLPAFNDSGSATALGSPNYETACARYGDPRLALPLAAGSRSTQQAFLAGVEELPPPPALEEPSRNFPAAGCAVLRAGTGAEGRGSASSMAPTAAATATRPRTTPSSTAHAAYGVAVQAVWYGSRGG